LPAITIAFVLDSPVWRVDNSGAGRCWPASVLFNHGEGQVFAEFKKFIMRGNVIDLAVAVVLGAAFGAVVTSLTNDILMPLIGILLGRVNFAGLSVTVGSAVVAYGKFIQAIINFLIIAFALFLIIKGINAMMEARKKEEAPAAPAAPPEDVVLLREIRDLLKQQR
jgi:large conductance mechanosensitive channel